MTFNSQVSNGPKLQKTSPSRFVENLYDIPKVEINAR